MTGQDSEVANPDQPKGWPLWFERIFLPFLEESTLWPILIVVVLHGMLAMGLLVLSSFVDRNVASMGGLALTSFMSFAACQFERDCQGKQGALTVVVVGSWLATFGLAYGVRVMGYY